MKNTVKYVFLPLVLALFAGCAGPKPKQRVLWPAPPEQPRLEWIVTFHSEDDFDKTDSQKASEAVLGKPELHFFRKPMGAASAGDGVVYVSDLDEGNIRVVDFNRKKNELFLRESVLRAPAGLAVDSAGHLYVADTLNRQVYVFDRAQKSLQFTFGSGQLQRPTFIALNERLGRIYVTDVKAHKVVVFSLEGKHLFDFGGPGGEDGKLYGPQGIAIDRNDHVFVAEQLNARVQEFDADGKFVSRFGVRGDLQFQFEGPRGLAFDSEGHLYVAETRKAALLVFTPDGKPLTAIGGERSLHRLGFVMPNSVAIDKNDRIYVTDGLARRLTIWQYLNKAYLQKFPVRSK